MEATFPQQCNRINPIPLILLLLAGIVSAIVYAVAMSEHALSKHGNSAVVVYQAFDCGKEPTETFHRGNRIYSVCWVPEKSRWGVVIEELVNGERQPVTAILKEKLSKLADVERWLTNTGATPGLP